MLFLAVVIFSFNAAVLAYGMSVVVRGFDELVD
jgi:hypothetical protein